MVNRNAGLVTSGASLPLGNDSCYHHAPLPSSTAAIDAINRRIYRHRWLVSSAFYTEIRPGKRRRGLPLLDEREPLRRCEVSDPLPLLPINLGESSRTGRVLSNTNARPSTTPRQILSCGDLSRANTGWFLFRTEKRDFSRYVLRFLDKGRAKFFRLIEPDKWL